MSESKLIYRPEEPAVIIGGFMSAADDYVKWQKRLERGSEGVRTFITNIERQYWLSSATRSGDYRLQMALLDQSVQQARHATGAAKVWLICHSAGGLAARLWMGDIRYRGVLYNGHRYVRGVIFLGSPYRNYEPVVRKTIEFAHTVYPGAYYARQGVKYYSLVGRAVYGHASCNFIQKFAHNSYRKVSPNKPNQWGDGIVTLDAAYVPGATNFVLDKVFHLGIMGQRSYGSSDVLPLWKQFITADSVSSSQALQLAA
jgi:pimeloyl-ACP methyl ester carboxylesterase